MPTTSTQLPDDPEVVSAIMVRPVTTASRPRRLLVVAAAAVALTGPFLLPTPASASVDVRGKVVFVADGDTFDVDIYGDGTSTPMRVRSIGINTMEQTVYSHDLSKIAGDCHSTEATRRLHALIYGKVVRLTSRYTSRVGARYRRSADVKINGIWRDVHWIMMREGHGLFLGNGVEYRKNRSYMRQAQYAKTTGKNLWDPDYCGVGPAANLRVSVKYDAVGKDAQNLNGEYLRVTNRGSTTVSLSGWHVRDGGPFNYNFPSWAKVGAGKTVYVHVGRGTSSGVNFYWGRTAPVFDNPTGSPQYNGDGGYLFDPKGNLRASAMWPTR
jgi:micrococcal nuclease